MEEFEKQAKNNSQLAIFLSSFFLNF